MENPLGILFVAIGVFTVLGGVFNWDWYMNYPKARFMTSLMGRGGARVFYIIFGLGVIAFGVHFTAGIIKVNPRR